MRWFLLALGVTGVSSSGIAIAISDHARMLPETASLALLGTGFVLLASRLRRA